MIDTITVKGFKSIASVEKLPLKAINVIVGANGSGKSNFIGVFSFIRALREGSLRNYVAKAGGANRVLHFGSKHTRRLDIEISFEGGRNAYNVQLEPSAENGLYPSTELVYFNPGSHPKPFSEGLVPINGEAGISNSKVSKTASWVRHYLGTWRVYHLHDTSVSSPMRLDADVADNRFLRSDGSNIAAFLHLLQSKHSASYERIQQAFQRVAPFFEEFVLKPQKLSPDTIRLEWKHQGSDAYFDVASLSDGSLRFLVLATLLLQPVSLRPSVVVVDEPELGLHPFAIRMLGSMVKEVAVETQVIVSTQSSLLIDQFDAEDIVVADRKDGGTHLSRLDPSALEGWLAEYSLGELWEKNELGGRPAIEK
ncbi:MAG: AAA family ATPase [Vicinamibacteria bacterium]